jgi:hypothetical protein
MVKNLFAMSRFLIVLRSSLNVNEGFDKSFNVDIP